MRLLLLAGTQEARQIVAALKSVTGLGLTVSVARPMRPPEAFGVATRIGGFGGDDGVRSYLKEEQVGAVLDATHPFAARVSMRSARICRELGVPYGQLLRPPWLPGPGDRWHFAEDETAAGAFVPSGVCVFIGTGQHRLDAFGPMPGRRVFVRQIDHAPLHHPPFEDGMWIVGHPPFDAEGEIKLFGELGIDWLVVRNAGGAASRPKLDAARELGIEVAMIRRPPRPEAVRFDTIAGAIAWARRVE